MYIQKKKSIEMLKEASNSLLDEISSHSRFFQEIVEDDDWSFVIKTHALVEACVSGLLVVVLGDQKISTIIERLPLSDTQMGKTVIAKQLGIMSDAQCKFIRKFSELRNRLVHNVENLSFSFDAHFGALDNHQKKSWVDAACWSLSPEEKECSLAEAMRDNPRYGFMCSLFHLVSILEVKKTEILAMRDVEDVSRDHTSEYIKMQDEMIAEQAELIAEQQVLLKDLFDEESES
ncbi:MAG: hypothetical protein PHP93_06560 [Kiritimatiellales bacterium]|nr:hypothetical protein [Kiritimatiellales bacterium]